MLCLQAISSESTTNNASVSENEMIDTDDYFRSMLANPNPHENEDYTVAYYIPESAFKGNKLSIIIEKEANGETRRFKINFDKDSIDYENKTVKGKLVAVE